MPRKLMNLIYWVSFVLILSILLSNLYYIAGRVLMKKELPKLCGFSQVVVLSGSMQPTIVAGDFLVIHECEEYHVGDVVTVREGGSLVTHRIISIQGDVVTTKGDANNVSDKPVPISNVEGKVVWRIPYFGSAVLYLRTPWGLMTLAAPGAFLVLVLLIKKRLQTEKE